MKYLLVLIISSLCFLSACGQHSMPLTDEEIRLIDSILVKDVPEGGAGLAIGIVREGKIIYEDYAGYENLEDSTLIDRNSRFNIASNGKQFTALAVLRLAHQNKLDLDDDIRTYLPNLFNSIQDKITISNLLNHTSGIRDFYDLWSLQGKIWWRLSANNGDVLEFLENQEELNFEPGSQYLYSNSNYVLLAEIIKMVSGEAFTNYTDTLFHDLGMTSSSFESDYANIEGPVAKPYFNFDTWTTFNWSNNIVGDGALFSTLPDQLQWEQVIQTNSSYPISSDIIEKSQNPITGSVFTNYGFGIEFDEYQAKKRLFHLGATGAWKAVTYRFLDERLAIVVLTNSGKVIPSLTARNIVDVLFDEDKQINNYKTEPSEIGTRVEPDDIVGTYQNENGFTFRFVQRGDELYLLRNGQNDTRIFRESANIFHQWNDPAFKQEFTISTDNKMQVTAYYTTHDPYTLTRIEADFTEYDFTTLEGAFINSETDVAMEISFIRDNEYKVKISDRELSGQLLKPTLLRAGNYSVKVRYENGAIEQLLLDGERIKNVLFERE